MSIQRYVSDELTHFVGRELSQEEQYATLVDKILKTGWLLSDPRVYTPTEANEVLDSKGLGYEYHPSAPVDEMYLHQVVCFCDIPITDLEIHMRKYSRFGLSFLKPFLTKKGANPVLYMAKNSRSLPFGVHDTEEIVGRHDLLRANITQFHELMEDLMRVDALVAGGGDILAQPVEVGRVELREVELRLTVLCRTGHGAGPRLRRHAEVKGAPGDLRPELLPTPEPDEVVAALLEELEITAEVVPLWSLGAIRARTGTIVEVVVDV
jgi:Putative abortive phage resistance protein AbiGi, antitoxin